MMNSIEDKLTDLLVTKAPYQIPEKGRLTIVKAMPWLTLIGGVLMALVLLQLYTVWNTVSGYYGAYSALSNLGYMAGAPAMGPLVWVSLGLLAAETILFFVAFPGLKERKKQGWNLLFWVSLLNVGYAVIYFFVQMGLSSLIFSLLGSVVSLYILFQVRSYYMGVPMKAASKAPSDSETPTPPAGK